MPTFIPQKIAEKNTTSHTTSHNTTTVVTLFYNKVQHHPVPAVTCNILSSMSNLLNRLHLTHVHQLNIQSVPPLLLSQYKAAVLCLSTTCRSCITFFFRFCLGYLVPTAVSFYFRWNLFTHDLAAAVTQGCSLNTIYLGHL